MSPKEYPRVVCGKNKIDDFLKSRDLALSFRVLQHHIVLRAIHPQLPPMSNRRGSLTSKGLYLCEDQPSKRIVFFLASHLCDNKDCLLNTHLTLELTRSNLERRRCEGVELFL